MSTTAIRRARWLAHNEIDRAAGEARLRYITDVPGQQATYMTKAQQAREFLGAPEGEVPPYVQAEAEAMGVAALPAAEYIAATEHAWSNVIGPGIERARRAGKLAVSAASGADEESTLAAIEAVRASVVQELNAA